nr:MAG TPA: hypothetical protein [Caudoviricetes sp.]
MFRYYQYISIKGALLFSHDIVPLRIGSIYPNGDD